MDMNFKEVDLEKTYTVYPRGPYQVRIKRIEDTTAQSGNSQLKVQTEILDPQEYQGKPLTDFITLVASCDWKLGKFINGCGIDIKKLPSMNTESGDFRALLNKLINKTSIWIVEQKADRDGNIRNNVVDYQVDPNAAAVEEADTPDFLQGTPEQKKWDEEIEAGKQK